MRCQESDRGTVLWNGVGTKGSGSSPASDDADRAQKAGRRGKAPCCVAASSVEEWVSTWRKCGQVRKAKDPAPTSRRPGPRQETLGRGAIPPRSSKRPRRKAACGTPKVQRSKNCTSRLSERAEAGRKPHLSRLYTRRTGEPFTGGSGWRQMTRSGATRAPCKGSDSPLCKERMKLTVETNLEGIAAKCCKPPVEERGAGHRRCSEAKTARHVLWEPGVGNCPR